MSYQFTQKNLLSSSLLVLSLFLLSPEGKAMQDDEEKMFSNNSPSSKGFDNVREKKIWSSLFYGWNRSETRAIPAQCGVKEEKGIIRLETKALPGQSYLLESLPLKNLQKKDKVKVSFRPQGELEGIYFALRDIKNRCLSPGKTDLPWSAITGTGLALQNNTPIDFETEIPESAGDEISVVFFNWGQTNATDFRIQNFNIQKEKVVKPVALSFERNLLKDRAIPAECDVKEEKGIITLKTNVLPRESYLLESLPLKNLQKKNKVKVSFTPQGELEGIFFALRDIKNRCLSPGKTDLPWSSMTGTGLSLKSNVPIDFETEIPESAGDEISIVFFNWAPTKETDFTLNNLEIEKEEVEVPITQNNLLPNETIEIKDLKHTHEKNIEMSQVTIGGRTPNQIVHNVVTETNRGLEQVKNLGVGVENIFRAAKKEVRNVFRKKKKKKK